MIPALLHRNQTPWVIVRDALIATIRKNNDHQCNHHQERCLTQFEIVNDARCFIDVVNQMSLSVCNDLRLDRMPLFLA